MGDYAGVGSAPLPISSHLGRGMGQGVGPCGRRGGRNGPTALRKGKPQGARRPTSSAECSHLEWSLGMGIPTPPPPRRKKEQSQKRQVLERGSAHKQRGSGWRPQARPIGTFNRIPVDVSSG